MVGAGQRLERSLVALLCPCHEVLVHALSLVGRQPSDWREGRACLALYRQRLASWASHSDFDTDRTDEQPGIWAGLTEGRSSNLLNRVRALAVSAPSLGGFEARRLRVVEAQEDKYEQVGLAPPDGRGPFVARHDGRAAGGLRLSGPLVPA